MSKRLTSAELAVTLRPRPSYTCKTMLYACLLLPMCLETREVHCVNVLHELHTRNLAKNRAGRLCTPKYFIFSSSSRNLATVYSTRVQYSPKLKTRYTVAQIGARALVQVPQKTVAELGTGIGSLTTPQAPQACSHHRWVSFYTCSLLSYACLLLTKSS